MKKVLLGFGIACFLIGTIITIDHKWDLPFFTTTQQSGQQDEEKLKKLQTQLEEANQYISELKQQIETINKEEEKTKDNEATEKNSKENVVSGTLYIYSGLTPAEVAQKLKDMGIIKNSVEMELFLAQPEYAKSIQKGQFELNSSMSIEEIANIITAKKQ